MNNPIALLVRLRHKGQQRVDCYAEFFTIAPPSQHTCYACQRLRSRLMELNPLPNPILVETADRFEGSQQTLRRLDFRLHQVIQSKTTVRLYPPDVDIIDAWAAANPDPDTGLTSSRPTAIRRMIRTACRLSTAASDGDQDQPASRKDLRVAVASILDRLDPQEDAS